MYTLGINAAFHDSAAALVKDGKLIAAAEEERFTHIKHGKRPVPFSAYELPFHAIDYCLKQANIHLRDVDHIAHSLGLLYEAVTTHLGFLHSSDEYKVMALASYGKPTFLDEFSSMIHLGKNGTYTIDEYLLEVRFGPARKCNAPFTQKHFDIAHSLQKVLGATVLQLVNWLYETTHEENLCMAGGVALNCVMNAVIRDHGPFKNIWVQPASGDAGTALGAALWTDTQERKTGERNFVMEHAHWGPDYTDEEVENFLKWTKVPYRKLVNVAKETA